MSIKDTSSADVTATGPTGYIEYEINVERILRAELPGKLKEVEVAPLTGEAIAALPLKAKGAYVLYEDGLAVYAGKTDTRHGFRDRLLRHSYTIQHRQGFDHSRIGFKAVRIMVFSNFDVEAILIKELRLQDKKALPWNNSGFGSNDPGHRRESQKPSPFDLKRPINIDRPLPFLSSGSMPLLSLLVGLKGGLPYDFRYETDLNAKGNPVHYRKGHLDQRAAPSVTVPSDDLTFRDVLGLVLAALPSGWRVTVFPGRVILYREDKDYDFAREYIAA